MAQLTTSGNLCCIVRNLLNEAELQHVWKGLLSNDSVVKHAYDVSILCSVCVLDRI